MHLVFLKPDLVIINRMEENMNIFELPVPLETIIKNANTQMMNKYEHFITDITTRNVCMLLSNCISSTNPV